MAQDWLDDGFSRRRRRTSRLNLPSLNRSRSTSRDSGQHHGDPREYCGWELPEQFESEPSYSRSVQRNERGNRMGQIFPGSRQQRRRRRFRNLLMGPIDNDVVQIHSDQSSPSLYVDVNGCRASRLSMYSAPDELEHEYIRSPTSAARTGYPASSSLDYPSSVAFPRSPTYPPVISSREHYNRATHDSDFVDEEEFHLFVQATTGLALDDTLSDLDPDPSSDGRPHRYNETHDITIWNQQEPDIVPPFDNTSDTLIAVRQLAQTPSFSPVANSAIDLLRSHFEPEPSFLDADQIDIVDEVNDELPNYEESQAQAHEHHRAEATRRAQELQMRWRQTGAQRAMHP